MLFIAGWRFAKLNSSLLSTAIIAFTLSAHMAHAESGGGKPQLIIYVDDDAPPNGDGLGWRTAFRHLQDALQFAAETQNNVGEIRIAQGLYKPDQGANLNAGDVNATFLVPPGIALRGGYAGLLGEDPDARDFEKFQTILSGDLLGNDGPLGSYQNYADNTRRIMKVAGTENVTLLEGLIIRGASGISTFGPLNEVGGGGLHCNSGYIEISHCAFEANRAPYGGGAFLDGANAEVTHCRFLLNQVGGPVNFGGGLYGGALVTDCQFIANRGISAAGAGAATAGNFTRCLFQDNTAHGHGGAVFTFAGQIIDCEFINNHSQEDGGAIYGYATIIGCTFRQNSADSGGAVRGIVTIIDSLFEDNSTFGYAGTGFRGGGTVVNSRFIANKALNSTAGGAVSPCKQGTGLIICAPAEFINCVFDSNKSFSPFSVGGGAWIESTQTGTFTNCTFTNNVSAADNGGAISTNNATLLSPPGFATVRNCVLWNNSPGELDGPVDVQFSCVTNGWAGQGNIASDPLFVDPIGPDGTTGTGDENLHLGIGSPCIDAGNNSALPSDELDLNGDGNTLDLLPIDLDGELRLVNDPNTPNTGIPAGGPLIVDMGAYEFRDFPPILGDILGNGIVGVDDLLALLQAWGPCPSQPPQPPGGSGGKGGCPADLDRNGSVNAHDLVVLLLNWG